METECEKIISGKPVSVWPKMILKSTVFIWTPLFLISVSSQALPQIESQILVFPFNQERDSDKHPWVSEALADLLSQAGELAAYHMISRSDRLDAFSILGLSPWRRPTLAMQLKMAEYLQATHMMYGWYQIDGEMLTAEVHLLDLQQLRLLKKYSLSTGLSHLPDIKQKLCTKIFGESFSGKALPCRASEFENEIISGQAYELFIKSLMDDSHEQKEQHLKQALKISPNFSRATVALGQLYFDNLKLDQTERILRAIENERSKYGAEACMIIGEISLEKKDYHKAVRVIKKAISYGGSGKSHLLLAKAYFHLGEFEKAFKESELSLRLDPSDIDAKEFRKILLQKKGTD
jgi:tetratricopeptide (TPR) repeat protein